MTRVPLVAVTAITFALAGARPCDAQQFETRRRAAAPYATATANGGIAVDLDQSGDMDVLLKIGAVMMGNGNLGFTWFQQGTRIPTVSGLPGWFHDVGDVDGDGIPDLVTLSVSLALVTDVLVNRGLPGGWFAPRTFAGTTPGFSQYLLLRDLDGDTFPDIVFQRLTPTTELGILRNQGNGTFLDVSAAWLPPTPMAPLDTVVASADTNGDATVDLVVRSNGALLLLLNAGPAGFVVVASGLPAVPSVQGLSFADVDADGDQDLLVATGAGAALQLWLGAGNGSFTAATATMPVAGTGHACRDLDGDQRADLVLVENTPFGQQLRVLRNVAGTQFQPVSVAPVDGTANLGNPLLTDLESDGDLDVILGGSQLFLNDGALGFSALQRMPIAETPIEDSIAVGDIDGDQFPDLVIGDTLHHNQGDGYFVRTGVVLPAGARAQAIADLDGNGDLDVVWTRAGVDAGILQNQLGVLSPGVVVPASLLGGRVAVGDFDNDGWPDLVSEARHVLRSLGGTSFASMFAFAFTDRFVTIGDFDADNRLDIVTRTSTQPGSWTIWRNLGNFVFVPQVTILDTLTIATPGDFDNDGRLDLATIGQVTTGGLSQSMLRVHYQQASGWVAGPTFPDGTATNGLAAADFDADGDLDLVGHRLWTNLGSGQFAMGCCINYATMLVVADFDGDRDLDVARAANLNSSDAQRPWLFTNQLRDLDADQMAILGRTCTIAVASRAGLGASGDLAFAALALTRIPAVSVPSLGLLQVDPASIVATGLGTTGANGLCALPFPLPLQPALAGMPIYWQGAVGTPTGLQLTGLLIDRLLL